MRSYPVNCESHGRLQPGWSLCPYCFYETNWKLIDAFKKDLSIKRQLKDYLTARKLLYGPVCVFCGESIDKAELEAERARFHEIARDITDPALKGEILEDIKTLEKGGK